MVQRNKISGNMAKIWVILCMALLSGEAFSQQEEKKIAKKKSFRVEGSVIANPLELRDPFKKKRIKSKKPRGVRGSILVDNSYSNIPSIGSAPIKSIRIVGILMGKERVAMAKLDNGNQVFFLREGMKIGLNKSELKAILPGGIVIVEKVRNAYDEDEYIETVIPFSGGT